MLRKLAASAGNPCATREMLQDVGRYVLDTKGEDFLARLCLREARKYDSAIIDGPRQIGIINALIERVGSAHVVWIEASDRLRELRLRERDGMNHASFLRHETTQIEADVVSIRGIADTLIVNEGSLSSFYDKMSELAYKIRRKQA